LQQEYVVPFIKFKKKSACQEERQNLWSW